MGHIIDLVILEEFECDDPWTWADDLIDPLAVLDDLSSLFLVHDDLAFLPYSLLVP